MYKKNRHFESIYLLSQNGPSDVGKIKGEFDMKNWLLVFFLVSSFGYGNINEEGCENKKDSELKICLVLKDLVEYRLGIFRQILVIHDFPDAVLRIDELINAYRDIEVHVGKNHDEMVRPRIDFIKGIIKELRFQTFEARKSDEEISSHYLQTRGKNFEFFQVMEDWLDRKELEQ